jgi:ATP-dependent RNA helicase DOB1
VSIQGTHAIAPELKREEESKDLTTIPDEALVAEYYNYRQQLDQMAADYRDVVTHPTYSIPFLQPGRLVKVKHMKLDFGWGVVINCQKRLPPKVKARLLFGLAIPDIKSILPE